MLRKICIFPNTYREELTTAEETNPTGPVSLHMDQN
jgi:hypothetical protein